MYACKTLSTTQGDGEKLPTFGRKILREIHGPVRLKSGENERRKNEDLEMLFDKLNIRLFPRKKRPSGRPRQRWFGGVKRDILDADDSKRLDDRNGWKNLAEA